MVDNQTTIFEMIYPTYKIPKPIRTIELFGGYGSQLLALKYIGANVEQWKLCEWAIKSIQAYKDLHCEDDNTNYSKDLTTEEIKEYLYKKGISSNYNDPMTKEQIKRLGEKQVRTIYNNIQATHNLVNIQQVKGKDLEIVDSDKFTYLLTYSFPCQDLSLAGKRQLMSDTSTRSGLLWEVERILTECKELNQLPDVLLMENVIQVHGEGAKEDFNKWQLRLEELGYKNYWQDLIATDYGIPQTRNRTFMVSILGDYNYTFPKPIPLKLKLKDLLEDNVDEKYYLSDSMKQYIFSENDKYKVNKNSLKLNRDIALAIKNDEKVIRKYGLFDKNNKVHQAGSVYDKEGFAPTLDTGTGGYRQPMIEELYIKNNTKQGYLKATEGDGIDLCQPNSETRRGRVQKNKTQTLTTMGGENNGVVSKDLRIRKLTPKECFRLMGVKDEDFEKCAKNQSDSSLYHLAGDSIVVNVLMAIFKEMI